MSVLSLRLVAGSRVDPRVVHVRGHHWLPSVRGMFSAHHPHGAGRRVETGRRWARGFGEKGFGEGVKALGANDGDGRARVGEADR